MVNKRMNKFREMFPALNIDAALITTDYNRNYLSGFTGDESFLVVTRDKALFITDSRYTEQASKQTIGCEVLEYKIDIHDFIGDILRDNNIKRLGFEEDAMSFLNYEKYREKLSGIELVKLNKAVEKLRVTKDEDEVSLIEKAASIADEAFSYILNYIKAGVREDEVALELEYFMKKHGAQGTSFTTIVASGKRSSLPHGVASEKVIENGDFVTLDFGCIYKGYCSDMTRTVVVGKASEEQKKIYNIVLEANIKALDGIKAGNHCKEVDAIARKHITKMGYGNRFGHGLGHGVGRQIHEAPRFSPKTDEILESGMIVTDEPGIYIPDFGGVRIEDLILVTENGYKILSKSPKDLIEL